MSVFSYLKQAKFGKLPAGKRLERIKQSPNYKNGSFQNQSITPDLTEGANYYTVGKEFFFGQHKNVSPVDEIPSTKTDLFNFDLKENILVWFGHSSYYIQIDGKRILVDPVLSGVASPFSFSTKAFKGTDRYATEDIPEIDYLFISHDHWDHLDYETILKLKPKIKKIICGLGTGEHFEYWGFDTNKIIEKDWNEKINLDEGFTAYTVPARHFSGRGLTRNKALWTSYVLQTPTMQIFLGGDSGYDKHFAEIGKTFGAFDLAILENGQYDKNWKYIHMMPDEILQAAKDLNAKRIFPVHSSKFALGNHPWYEPLELITKNNKQENLNIITPMIGEQVNLKDTKQQFSQWWKDVK
ncbi:MBL fold metallo-hydrolase [Flavobacterium sp. ZS1P14]|uniref:MBL fold metallo-hydrolase n=1 Tax=Flavobacterium sp. ZS1P14 TaxID=3401729 RepID=UPI003AAD6E08